MDPPDEPNIKSGRVMKSDHLLFRFLRKKPDKEEDNLFLDKDLLDEFKKKTHFNC